MFVDAILSRLSEKYKSDHRTTLLLVSGIIMSAYILKEITITKDYSVISLLVKLFPIIAISSWVFAAAAFRRDIIMQIAELEIRHNSKCAEITSRLDSIINERNASIVKLPDDFPLGPRTPSGVTIVQILRHLVSTSSAEQQRSIGRSYLGQFVTWECKIYSWESIGNGQLEFTLGIVNGIHPSIFVKALESEAAHIKTLPPHSSVITVEGRIYEICTVSRNIRIDYPNLAFNREASSHPSGAAPSP